MRCPLCETENHDDDAECRNCGKQLHTDAELLEDVVPIEGLEETLRGPADGGEIEMIPELQQTMVASKSLRIQDERVPGVERTQLVADASVQSNWTTGNVDLDLGREQDQDPRTALPQDDGTCPWCGAAAAGAVCDSCGRRRSRYSSAAPAAAAAQAGDETVLCPACFARVAAGPRCVECGVRLGASEN